VEGVLLAGNHSKKLRPKITYFFIQLRHAMKLADAEISAESSSVTRELPVSFLSTKPLAVPRTSLQQNPAGNICALSLEVATTVHVSGNVF